jgi:hypothetical protein
MYIETRTNSKGEVTYLVRSKTTINGKKSTATVFSLNGLPCELREFVLDEIRVSPRRFGKPLLNTVLLRDAEVEYLEYGMSHAVLTAMDRDHLDFGTLLASMSDRNRRIVMAMVVMNIVNPSSKAEMARMLENSHAARVLGLRDITEHDMYNAMDELLRCQLQIEAEKLRRHFEAGKTYLLDASNCRFTGKKSLGHDREGNPVDGGSTLLKWGHSKDKRKGDPLFVFCNLGTMEGLPLLSRVFPGNTSDPEVALSVIGDMRTIYHLKDFSIAGDRGTFPGTVISKLSEEGTFKFITAIRHSKIASFIPEFGGSFGLLDEKDILEFGDPEFPGERLLACRNPVRQAESLNKRTALINLTVKELDKVKARVANPRSRLREETPIAIAATRAAGKYKMGKFFKITCRDGFLDYALNEELMETEKLLDGIYVIRTSLTSEEMSAIECVRGYKALSYEERGFRIMKSLYVSIRPFFHRKDTRIKAHMLLCTLSLYVIWHLKQAWAPLTFSDTDLAAKAERSPVATAVKSDSARRKASTRRTEDGHPVMTYMGIKRALGTAVMTRYLYDDRGRLRLKEGLYVAPKLSAEQRRIMAMLDTIRIKPSVTH